MFSTIILQCASNGTALTRDPFTSPPRNPQNSTLDFVKTSAKNEYVGIFESLGDGSITIAVTVVVIIVISLIFALARTNLFAAKVAAEAQREREEADEAREMAEAKVLELRETNLKIRKELQLSGLNKDQTQIVKNKSSRIRELVPSVYRLEWTTLLFEARLGSGSFGDCYKGTRAGRPVAIKKMRAGGFSPSFVTESERGGSTTSRSTL